MMTHRADPRRGPEHCVTRHARASYLMVALIAGIAVHPPAARAQARAATSAKPCSAAKLSPASQLENAPMTIALATDKDQTLVVRVVVEQPYIDDVATSVRYDGLDRAFIIEWELDKTPGKLWVHESRVTDEPVVADILDCTDKGVSMPARFTPVTAPRLFPNFIAVREKWSRQFDEGTASSAQIGAVAMVLLLRMPAGPVAAPAAGAASTSRGQTATTARPAPSPNTASAAKSAPTATAPAAVATNHTAREASGEATKRLLPGLRISNKQFGKKVGKHAEDFGLDAANPSHRQWVRARIEKIVGSHDEVRQGAWNPRGGGGSDFLFYRQGADVVVTKPNGDFVTVLPGGQTNGWYRRASPL